MEPEAGSVDALDEEVGMGFGDRVFGHFITNGMLSLAAFLCVSCSLATIVIDESIEHGASIPAITDWYWDLESVVFDEPLGPWDGTYEGNATPYGEPEELFDEQNNSITVIFRTLPNGDSIACGGAVVPFCEARKVVAFVIRDCSGQNRPDDEEEIVELHGRDDARADGGR